MKSTSAAVLLVAIRGVTEWYPSGTGESCVLMSFILTVGHHRLRIYSSRTEYFVPYLCLRHFPVRAGWPISDGFDRMTRWQVRIGGISVGCSTRRATDEGWGLVEDPGGLFGPTTVRWYPTVQWFDGDGFADHLRSTSLYRKLDHDVREPLLDAIAERIRTRMGDRASRRYLSVLRLGLRG